MNVTFRLATEELEKAFVKESTAAGFDGLKGHRSVGGMRASIYNAFPEDGVDAAGRVHARVRTPQRIGRASLDTDSKTLDRGPLSLELKASGFGARVGARDGLVGSRAHEDLSATGRRLEASGRIRDVTDGGEVLEAAAADVADVLLTGADPDADLQPAPCRRPVSDAPQERPGGLDRLPGKREPASPGTKIAMTSSPAIWPRIASWARRATRSRPVEAMEEGGRLDAGQLLGDRTCIHARRRTAR